MSSRSYKPSLEGIRGIAFLLVFLVHYSGHTWTLEGRPWWDAPWLLLCQFSFCTVPVFFALSGYLITGVLLNSRERGGFFRVFYLRRAIRVLPLYYVTLIGVAIYALSQHTHLLWRHALLFTYFFNYWPKNGYYSICNFVYIGHFWSLAVEEQFYLFWPLVIWFVRDRKTLLRICFGVIAVSFIARLTFPLWHINSVEFANENTLFRCDAIMLGAALSIKERELRDIVSRLVKPARWTLAGSALVITVRMLMCPSSLPFDSFGQMVIFPLLSLMGASFVVLALQPGTWTYRASTWQWAIYLGQRSYALYVLHELFMPVFEFKIIVYLTDHLGRGYGRILGMSMAFLLTLALAEIAFYLLEQPALRLKTRIRHDEPATREPRVIEPSRHTVPNLMPVAS